MFLSFRMLSLAIKFTSLMCAYGDQEFMWQLNNSAKSTNRARQLLGMEWGRQGGNIPLVLKTN